MIAQDVCNVDKEFLLKLIEEINCKLAKSSYRHFQKSKFGLPFMVNSNNIIPLIHFKAILESLLNCADCLACHYDAEQIVSAVKNKLNEL